MVGSGLVLEAVAVVEVPVLIGVERLHHPLPGLELLVEHAEHRGRGVQLQMLADVRVLQPRAPQQGGRVNRAAGRDHGARADRELVALDSPADDPARAPILDEHALHLGSHHDPGPRAGRVREPRLDDRLLGADPAPETAVTALPALRAVAHPAGHGVDVPTQLNAPLLHLAVARGRLVVLLVDAEPLADRVETDGVLL